MPEPAVSHPPLRVLEVMESTEGGTRRHLMDIVTHLPVGRFQVSVACSTRRDPHFLGDIRRMTAMGVRVHEVPMRRDIRPIGDLIAFLRLWRIMRRGGFDVVHTHSAKAGFLGRLAGRLARVPRVIHTPHTFPFEMDVGRLSRFFYLRLERLAGRSCDRIVCVSPSQRALARSVADPDLVVLIENGIPPPPPPEASERTQRRRELGLNPDIPVAAVIGRFTLQKGHDVFIEAARQVAERLPSTRFVLVGDGELRTHLENLILAAGMKERFLLTGAREDAGNLLAAFDVVVLPSLWEGLPYTLLEAMAAGRGVVATRVGGMPDVIENGVDGLLVPPKDPAALAEAMATLLDNEKLRSKMGAHARRTVLNRYDIRETMSRLAALYEGML